MSRVRYPRVRYNIHHLVEGKKITFQNDQEVCYEGGYHEKIVRNLKNSIIEVSIWKDDTKLIAKSNQIDYIINFFNTDGKRIGSVERFHGWENTALYSKMINENGRMVRKKLDGYKAGYFFLMEEEEIEDA